MQLLLIEHIISRANMELHTLIIAAICLLIAFFLLIADLIMGTIKAKRRGEDITSDKRKRTVSKFMLYIPAILFAYLGDELIVFSIKSFTSFPNIPLVTIGITLVIIWTEIKSLRETAEEKLVKDMDKSLSELLSVVAKVKDKKVLNTLIELAKEKEKKNENN